MKKIDQISNSWLELEYLCDEFVYSYNEATESKWERDSIDVHPITRKVEISLSWYRYGSLDYHLINVPFDLLTINKEELIPLLRNLSDWEKRERIEKAAKDLQALKIVQAAEDLQRDKELLVELLNKYGHPDTWKKP